MNYEVKILDEKAIKLLLYLEEMQLIQFIKKIPVKKIEPQQRSFGGRISKETAADLHRQLDEMRNEWDRI
jgi:hypothetical protein